jgi:hypothetical protein
MMRLRRSDAATCRIWLEEQWRIINPQLRRALKIRRHLGRQGWWN